MKNSTKIRPLAEIINDLASCVKHAATLRPHSPRAQVELTQALQAATWKGESMMDHWLALDRLASQLISNQYNCEAATVSRCALDLICSVRAIALEDASLLVLRCHLLAKLAHAGSRAGKFSESLDADRQLGAELISVLRSGADFPVQLGGIAALVDYLATQTCAPPLPKLITSVKPPLPETIVAALHASPEPESV